MGPQHGRGALLLADVVTFNEPDDLQQRKFCLLKSVLQRVRDGTLSVSAFWVVEAVFGADISYSAKELQRRLSNGFVV